MILLERTREGQRQSDEHNNYWNRFKGNVRETSERRGGAHFFCFFFAERIDTILNLTELAEFE